MIPPEIPFPVREPRRRLEELLREVVDRDNPKADELASILRDIDAGWLREVEWMRRAGNRERDEEVSRLDQRVAVAEGTLSRLRDLIDLTLPQKESP